jgi:hypothetical protein
VRADDLKGGGLLETTDFGLSRLSSKKEEFTGFMKTCCLGTPFPRSALFLEASWWIAGT